MMMLRFKDLSGLKTKRIVFEDGFKVDNCAITIELLKELTAKRREMSEGLTSRHDQMLDKLDEYLPLLECLVHYLVHVVSSSYESRINQWVSRLKIRWTSALSKSCNLTLNGPKFYQMDSLQYERAMTLFLYGSVLRERALEEPLADLAHSATLLRKAAGVFEHLASYVLPLLPPLTQSTQSRPAEVMPCLSNALSLVCLAEAQAASVMRAQQRGTTSSLLAKLNMGVAEFFDQASVALQAECNVTKDLTLRFPEFVSCSRGLYTIRGYAHYAESLKDAGEFGNAIGLLNLAMSKAKKEGCRESTWKSIIGKEASRLADMRKKYEYENNFLTQEKTPLEHELPFPESKRIVELIPYQPRRRRIQTVQLETWRKTFVL